MKLDTTSSAARLRRLLSAGALALGLTTQAATVYTNQTAFEAALGGVPGYLNAFDDLDAYCPGTAVPAPRTYSSGGLSYRAIYRVDNAQVGQWSAPVSVTVPA